MNIGQISTTGSTQMCAGGLFDIGSTVGSGQGVPAWIVGDTFLKNVYSVFQANPPSVGFAQLPNGLDSGSIQIHTADWLLICIQVPRGRAQLPTRVGLASLFRLVPEPMALRRA